jgi:hypothetical protein
MISLDANRSLNLGSKFLKKNYCPLLVLRGIPINCFKKEIFDKNVLHINTSNTSNINNFIYGPSYLQLAIDGAKSVGKNQKNQAA